jgi:hypothetical protein
MELQYKVIFFNSVFRILDKTMEGKRSWTENVIEISISKVTCFIKVRRFLPEHLLVA